MKKTLLALLSLGVLWSCSKDENEVVIDEPVVSAIDFNRNTKSTYENELSAKISYDDAVINYFSTKSVDEEKLDAITFTEVDETLHIDYNATRDTLLIYNEKSTTEALRVYDKEGSLVIESIEIDELNQTAKVLANYYDDTETEIQKTSNKKLFKSTDEDKSIFQEFVDWAKESVRKLTLPGRLKNAMNNVDGIIKKIGAEKKALVQQIKSWSTKDEASLTKLEQSQNDNTTSFNYRETDWFKYLQKKWWEYRTVDCHGVMSGDAFYDKCGICVEGTTDLPACTQDCNKDWGGSAYYDNCGDCVGGNTKLSFCKEDCNLVWGGTAYYDNCGDCVGGNTERTACVQDCNLDWGGTAYYDNCGDCVGGNTGLTACVQDCNLVWGGTAYYDNCGDCVGGNTKLKECEGVICITKTSGYSVPYKFTSPTTVTTTGTFQQNLEGTYDGNSIYISYWHSAGLNKYLREYYLTIVGNEITGTEYYCKTFNGGYCTGTTTEYDVEFTICGE